MKLLISFLSILSLGSAVNHHPLRLSDAQREKIQSRMLENAHGDDLKKNGGTCRDSDVYDLEFNDKLVAIDEENTVCTEDQTDNFVSCTFNYGNATAVDQYENICVNNLDGRVNAVNIIHNCTELKFDDYAVPLSNYIGVPVCVPNTCTDEEVLASDNYFVWEQTVECFDCVVDMSFDKQKSSPKSKEMKKAKSKKAKKAKSKKTKKAKSKKTKRAKTMKGSKTSKSN